MNLKYPSLQQLFTAIADSIRAKGNVSYNIKADDFPEKIMELVEGGVTLPTLTNPGTEDDLLLYKELIDENGNIVTGKLKEIINSFSLYDDVEVVIDDGIIELFAPFIEDAIVRTGCESRLGISASEFGDALPEDVAEGKIFTSASGLRALGTFKPEVYEPPNIETTYPEGAFIPVQSFTDGKQYALIGTIDGQMKYINTSTYNNYTMNATNIDIQEEIEDYILFSSEPVLFTAVDAGTGFYLQNGNNYLYGTNSGGTALRVGETQAIWTIDTSANPGFSEGKYYAKSNELAVWLMNTNTDGDYSIKYETAGSYGYDREGRDTTYSTGFISFVLYEYVGGQTTTMPMATAEDVLKNTVFYDSEGNPQVGTLQVANYYYGSDEPDADLGNNGDIYFVMG